MSERTGGKNLAQLLKAKKKVLRGGNAWIVTIKS